MHTIKIMKWFFLICKKIRDRFLTKIFDSFLSNRLAILSGILIGTSWIPLPPWALSFCLIPLWISLSKTTSIKQAFWSGWWTQFFLTLIGFYWIAYVTVVFGFMHWSVGLLVLLAFAGFMHIYLGLASAISVWLKQKFNLNNTGFFLTCAGTLALLEYLWPSIFPWNFAYPLMGSNSNFAQWADVFGMYGISFLVLLTNALLAMALQSNSKVKKGLGVVSIVIALSVAWYLGQERKNPWLENDGKINILAVQANIGNLEKVYAEKGLGYQQSIIEQYFELTKKGLEAHPNAELIIWPETAFPDILDSYNHSKNHVVALKQFLASVQKPLLTGGYSKDPPSPKKRYEYNGMFLMDSNGNLISEPYHKTHLLIFGEYMPFAQDYEWLAKINPAGSGFGRGTGPMVFDFNGLKIGPQICYEGLYPEFSNKLTFEGAQLMVNVTNDSWFGPTSEPYQHMYMTLSRAIENRRPLVRVTNTGITTAVQASGEVLQMSPIYQPWFGNFEIQYRKDPPTTFFTLYGKWMWLMPLLTILFAVAMFSNFTAVKLEPKTRTKN